MRVSIIIPHLRGVTNLLNLLDDLKKEVESVPGSEVLVVDNASTDGSVQKAKEKHPWIRILSLPKNYGYAGGCNFGIRETSGYWIWLINDDIRISPGVLQNIIDSGDSASDIAAVQPKILSLQKPEYFDFAGGAGGMIDRFGYPFALGRIGGHLEEDNGQYDNSREIFWASGTACLWRRKTLKEIGILDSSFFAHMEEIDLAWRAWNRGWRIISEPHSVIHHLGGGTLSYQSWRKMFLNHRNSLATLVKNQSFANLLCLIPSRLILDHGIGIVDLVSGRPGRIIAVWAGWFGFILRIRRLIKQRKLLNNQRKMPHEKMSQVVYRGCILFAYLRGTRSATALAKH